MMSAEGLTIVNNLKGRVHAVNSMTAISGINDTIQGLQLLQTLIDNDIVIEETLSLPDGNEAKLYRYNHFRRGLQPKSTIRAIK
jgi:hypothetical protein